jgi:hypothetical protein
MCITSSIKSPQTKDLEYHLLAHARTVGKHEGFEGVAGVTEPYQARRRGPTDGIK